MGGLDVFTDCPRVKGIDEEVVEEDRGELDELLLLLVVKAEVAVVEEDGVDKGVDEL